MFTRLAYLPRHVKHGNVRLRTIKYSNNLTKNPAYLGMDTRYFASYSGESSTNITYSGGQASEGQGGYYGSGGARALASKNQTVSTERSKMLALADDVESIKKVMEELDVLENLLRRDQEENDGKVTNRSIELRGSIKHLMTNKEFMECLNRLEITGEPVW
eukprot:CAMPEP_0184864054 /NCGR_PEP_ID=MMETSP0580-20130426/13500_1 /TAXON_ID=1118495 /ORGANISM="Dactyliosolen fragilissimus" /LENGTH=160 /DNA_ID=CAMNT_0027362683 /DNA_START=88 /DNA_END=567 /DNA_ORIENTATION=+